MTGHSTFSSPRVAGAVAVALGSVLLVGCSVTIGPAAEGPTAGTGDNSAFSEAGVQHIVQERSAILDLRGPLTADDLGADGAALRDVDVRGEDPIEVTVRGTEGDLVVPAEVIRVLVGTASGEVQSIALFEPAQDADALSARLGEIGPRVGVDVTALNAYASSLGDEPSDIWLNGGHDLGFTVGLHPVHNPQGQSVLEFQLTPPD